jgi:aminoglycoside phosphotransferase (APT) family kinase protein
VIPGYTIERRADRGESDEGAWFAVDREGQPVVLKWSRDVAAVPRFEALAASLDALRAAGYPAPAYTAVEVVDDVVVVAQTRLEGRIDVASNERTVEDVLALNPLQAGVDAPRYDFTWGEFVVHSLTVGEDGWCLHEPMRSWSPRTRALVERAEAIGADADPAWFPDTGIVHLDLHPGNFLFADDGSIAGVVDWEGAMAGDHRFDLTSFAFCTAGNDGTPALVEPVWRHLEATVDGRVLRAYAAHQAIRLVDWMIRHHQPADVDRWLDASEALLARFD